MRFKLRIIVTGGAGFIGSNLVDKCLANGNEVVVIDDLSTGTLDNLRDAIEGPYSAQLVVEQASIDSSECSQIIADFKPNVIFHLAAQTDVRTSVVDPSFDANANVLGSINVYKSAAASGVSKVVVTQTAALYGDADLSLLPLKTDVPYAPLSPYGLSKLACLNYGRYFASITPGMQVADALLANVYGPRQGTVGEGGVVAIFAKALVSQSGVKIFGDGNQTRDFVYVGDVVDGLITLADVDTEAVGDIFHISTQLETSVNQLARMCDQTASKFGLEPMTVEFVDAREGEIARSFLDNARTSEMTGWSPKVRLEDGLHRLLTYMSQN